MKSSYFDSWYFLVAFCIGIFLVYIFEKTPEIILKYPTPYNAGKIIYRDSADVCYVYDKEEVDCPFWGAKTTPLQNTLK